MNLRERIKYLESQVEELSKFPYEDYDESIRYEYEDHTKKPFSVYTAKWAEQRQLTGKWGCPSIIKRMVNLLNESPDIYFGVTDGIKDKKATTVDINPDNNPTVVADWSDLPFEDKEFDFAFWDPVYDRLYPECLREILRVTKRRVAILHQIVYPNPIGWIKRAMISITTGPIMRVRELQIYDCLGYHKGSLKANPLLEIFG